MADLVIVGAGPQALTLCCLLLQKRPRWRRRLRIVDPSGTWLTRWQQQMECYEIPWLRSPSPHHPHPNPHALRNFAHLQQRNRQLEGPYGLPHTGLFGDFCRQVTSEYQLTDCIRAASVERIRLPKVRGGPMELALSDGTTMAAGRLVIATGSGTPQMPAWVGAIAGDPPPDALQHSDRIHLPSLHSLLGQRILIVGGGLTSAHLALGALRRGARVHLLCRRILKHKPFDADPGWLGPKYLKAFHAEPCMRRRQRQVLEARDGGSMTPETAAQLRQAQRGGALHLHDHCEVSSARWCASHWTVVCTDGHGLEVDRIWLATGHRQGVSQHPLLRHLQQQQPNELLDDWPVLEADLRWPGTLVHVMGGLSALQIGPAARNLFGGRLAAQRICQAVMKT
ncbi:SidA/IucD/PvdA family monooxygenase [Cyanobium sp. Aljojuca 7D2]|uniref:FAD/NAD(P)-binding protein n=1 Tax=Cyanobium sp. Aljojuca 7D2 TaxID=2823698 RepID=UPI0020CD6011|nr:FAD/NAD(P)-binding protein [Cyanobium sp. Aljojuca 7D2]MCP9891765.1 SidA/IucD/PvdA family monooxygenase [Cyanobium sp. Aljojuca 7D2]